MKHGEQLRSEKKMMKKITGKKTLTLVFACFSFPQKQNKIYELNNSIDI